MDIDSDGVGGECDGNTFSYCSDDPLLPTWAVLECGDCAPNDVDAMESDICRSWVKWIRIVFV